MKMPLSFATLSLSASLLLCVYLTHLVTTPPNPNPPKGKSDPTDSLARFLVVTHDRSVLRSTLICMMYLFHVILIFVPDIKDRQSICLHPELLNENLFSWSLTTAVYVSIIFVAAPIRLLAYRNLGTNFTFKLAKPNQLITTGVYRYVQHPSYTALLLVMTAMFYFTVRRDGICACLLPLWALEIKGWSVLPWVLSAVASVVLRLRVRDEERMMKETFGKEWDVWHRRTKRFIPGIF
jgi:protein-S-isoprenylcysteine O-methyltransferase Ste14